MAASRSCKLDSPDPPLTVRKNWPAQFLQRRPDLEIQTSCPPANERKWSHDIDNLEVCFERYKRARETFGILNQDTWDYGETGFRVRVGGKQKIIVTKHSDAKIFHGDADDCEHLSSDKFISDRGYMIDPFVILKGQYHLEKFYSEGEFTANTSIGLSEWAYLTNELMIPLLEHLDI